VDQLAVVQRKLKALRRLSAAMWQAVMETK
jgi:hypothetical protein